MGVLHPFPCIPSSPCLIHCIWSMLAQCTCIRAMMVWLCGMEMKVMDVLCDLYQPKAYNVEIG